MNTQEDPNADAPVDFAIVTALSVERDAIRARLSNVRLIQEPNSPYPYYYGTVAIPNSDESYHVVATMLVDPGNVDAGIGTTHLIQRWNPQHVFMVGIAGGIGDAGVSLGDVVVARYVHYYEPGKQTEEGEQRRPTQLFSDVLLFSRAQSYEAADWKSDVLVHPPNADGAHVPVAHFGPIASGEQVIASKAALEDLRKEVPKLKAVAMEGAGVARASAMVSAKFLEIRGISDLADARKNDDWHDYAANAAAAFAIGYLRSRPVEPYVRPSGRTRLATAAELPPLTIIRAQSLRLIRPDELLPAFPESLQGRDLTTVSLDFTDLSSQTKVEDPDQAVARLVAGDGHLLSALTGYEGEFIFHGLVAIPLAFTAGYLVADRRSVHLFDYHPDLSTWSWPDDIAPPQLVTMGLPEQRSIDSGEVVVRISITLPVTSDATAPVIANPLAAIDLTVLEPRRNLIRSEQQVRTYGQVFRQVLDDIVRLLPNTERVHVFYSGPVSLAFHLGQQVSENIHPPVTVWNYSRGYDWGVDLEAVSRGELAVSRIPPT